MTATLLTALRACRGQLETLEAVLADLPRGAIADLDLARATAEVESVRRWLDGISDLLGTAMDPQAEALTAGMGKDDRR